MTSYKHILKILLINIIFVSCSSKQIIRNPNSTCNYYLSSNYKIIDNTTLNEIELFLKQESHIVDKLAHATQVRLQTNEVGQPILTGKVVILIHGLFLSPAQMINQQSEAYRLGYNVINLRLKGHFEKDKGALDLVTAEDWIIQVNLAFMLAKKMGDQISLVGHSTGGLLVTYLTLQNPDVIDRVILLAPALKINRIKKFEAYFLSILKISSAKLQNYFLFRTNRPKSALAAWQVIRLSEMLDVLNKKKLQVLSGELITIIDLKKDEMIDTEFNRNLFNSLYHDQATNGVNYIEIPEGMGLTHADINFNTKTKGFATYVGPAISEALSYEVLNRIPNSKLNCN